MSILPKVLTVSLKYTDLFKKKKKGIRNAFPRARGKKSNLQFRTLTYLQI